MLVGFLGFFFSIRLQVFFRVSFVVMDSSNISSKSPTAPNSNLISNAPILKSILRNKGAANVIKPHVSAAELLSSVGQHEGLEEDLLRSGLAAKLKSVDGPILSRDGKVLKPYRVVKFADHEEVRSTDLNRELGNDKGSSGMSKDATGGATQVASAKHVSFASQVTNTEDSVQPTVVSANVGDNGKHSSVVGSQQAPKLSYASMFQIKNTFKSVNICELRNEERVEGAHVTIPLKEIHDVSARFAHTLYGYFIGKRLAFPIVENYVKNTWAKFGLERVMLNNGFFLFQFSTKDGMDKVLETGPWLIRSIPIFLNIWTPNTTLAKEEVTSAPLWVKLHKVPIVAYTEVGLSLITTQIGKPIMLDSYTSTMCVKSWGRNSYARALIEVSSINKLMDHVVVAIPFPNGLGHSLERIEIEYEWQPPRCDVCKNFDHDDAACPKKVKQSNVKSTVDDDGFVEATKRKGKGKVQTHEKVIDGVRFAKPKVTFNYRWQPVSKTKGGSDGASSSKGNVTNKGPIVPKEGEENGASSSMAQGINNDKNEEVGLNALENQVNSEVPASSKYIHDDLSDIFTKNSFGALSSDVTSSEFGFEEDSSQENKGVHVVDSDTDNEVDEYIECGKRNTVPSNKKEASTSSSDVPHV